jgi:hypothetical protein
MEFDRPAQDARSARVELRACDHSDTSGGGPLGTGGALVELALNRFGEARGSSGSGGARRENGTVGDMDLRVYGVPLRPGDARNLAARLVAAGDANGASAAASIGRTLKSGGGLVHVKDVERNAILYALDGDPPAGLVQLRGVLARDAARRHRVDTPTQP